MNQYIQKIRQKSDQERKQYAMLWTIVSMAVVGSVWMYSISNRFDSRVSEQTVEDVKPFSIFSKTLSATYKNIYASVGSINQAVQKVPAKETSEIVPEKVIDLIPIEPTSTQ